MRPWPLRLHIWPSLWRRIWNTSTARRGGGEGHHMAPVHPPPRSVRCQGNVMDKTHTLRIVGSQGHHIAPVWSRPRAWNTRPARSSSMGSLTSIGWAKLSSRERICTGSTKPRARATRLTTSRQGNHLHHSDPYPSRKSVLTCCIMMAKPVLNAREDLCPGYGLPRR